MKKIKKFLLVFMVVVVMVVVGFAAYMILSQAQAKAELKKESIRKMLSELERERKKIELERSELDQARNNLKNYELELERKHERYLSDIKVFKDQQDAFNKKINEAALNKQIIETYENIDPTEAAKLILDLYKKDQGLTVRLLRKISGRKAGKIIQEMISLERATAANLAKETLDLYKPQNMNKTSN